MPSLRAIKPDRIRVIDRQYERIGRLLVRLNGRHKTAVKRRRVRVARAFERGLHERVVLLIENTDNNKGVEPLVPYPC